MWSRVKHPTGQEKTEDATDTASLFLSRDNLPFFHLFLFFFRFLPFQHYLCAQGHHFSDWMSPRISSATNWDGREREIFILKTYDEIRNWFLLDSPNAGALEIATGCCFMTEGSAEELISLELQLDEFHSNGKLHLIHPSIIIHISSALQNNSMGSEWLWP